MLATKASLKLYFSFLFLFLSIFAIHFLVAIKKILASRQNENEHNAMARLQMTIKA
jgi:hypothetical protein